MTNPLGPKSNEDKIEKDAPAEKPETPAGLTFSEIVPKDLRHEAQRAAEGQKAEKALPASEHMIPRDLTNAPKATYNFAFGQRPAVQFQLRKSEFKPDIEKPVAELRPLVDDFLKNTPDREDSTLTPAEKNELTQTRDALSRADTAADALTKALHLARLYQHLRYIEEAKKATDLSLGIDPDNHLGVELFKELERMHPPDLAPAVRVTKAPGGQLTKSNLRRCINGLAGGRVMVVGDLLIDELLEGKPERISREAPVLILEHVDTVLIPGGAANTANNIASLGGQCLAVGVCGRDEYAGKLAGLFDQAGIKHSLVQDPSRPTTVKTRILSKAHALMQQLLRLDRISHEPIGPLVEAMLTEKVKASAGQYAAIVISDYRGGAITDGIIKACKAEAATKNLMVIVDAQEHPERFQDVTLITPNQPDTEKMVGFALNSMDDLKRAGEELLLLTGATAILVTRGAQGMALFQKGQEMTHLPVFNKSEVFDVTGAGDTVVATMALALVTGCDFVEAMALGNLAAGIVVRKPGTAVTNQQEMLEALEHVSLSE